MHKLRIQSIIRLCLLFGLLSYGIYTSHKKMSNMYRIRAEQFTVKNIYVPKEEDKNLLKDMLNLVNIKIFSPPPELIPGIIDFKKQQIKFNIKLIFLGKEKFVVINNFLYTTSSMLPDGRIIIGINKHGVLVENPSTLQKELIKYSPPDKVVLEKPNTQYIINKSTSMSEKKSNFKNNTYPTADQKDINMLLQKLKR